MPFAQATNNKMQSLAGMGRGGDTAMAHLTPGEVVIPKSIVQMYPDLVQSISDAIRRRGRNPRDFIVGAPEGPLNPVTGVEEFGFGGDGVGGGEAGDSPGGGGFGGDSTGGDVGFGDPDTVEGGPGFADAPPGTIGGDLTAPDQPLADFGAPTTVTPDSMSPEQQTIDRDIGFQNPGQRPGDPPDRRGQIQGLGGPRGATRAEPGAAVAEPRGFFGALGEAFSKATETTKTNAGLGLMSSIPGPVGMVGIAGKLGKFGVDAYNAYGEPAYSNPIGGTPADEQTAPDAQGGPLGRDSGEGQHAQQVANSLFPSQAPVPGAGMTMPPVQAPASGTLSPPEAARIANELGIHGDHLQQRAQIATFALNANGADFRTPEAAALWQTLLAQSYSPNPGLLDIERQYMAQVLGHGDQAYEGEDQAAFTLAGTGSPIIRAQPPGWSAGAAYGAEPLPGPPSTQQQAPLTGIDQGQAGGGMMQNPDGSWYTYGEAGTPGGPSFQERYPMDDQSFQKQMADPSFQAMLAEYLRQQQAGSLAA